VASASFDQHDQALDRYNMLLVSMLLLLTTLQRDMGYGHVEYLTIIDVQSLVMMILLMLCLGQTIIRHKLGATALGDLFDTVGRQTLIVFATACAIGFLVQLLILRPSASSVVVPSGEGPPVFAELKTGETVSHLWPWIVFGVLWLALNVMRIVYLHRAPGSCWKHPVHATARRLTSSESISSLGTSLRSLSKARSREECAC